MKPPKGQLGKQGTGNQGMGQKGNSLAGDLLKTNKETMPKADDLQAQSQVGVVVGDKGFSGEIRFDTPARYPHGLA